MLVVLTKACKSISDMKRYNNLFSKIVELNNLYLADIKARKSKGHRKDILWFDKNKDLLLLLLLKKLVDLEYTTSGYSTFIIKEPKERLIFKLPYYPDRIVHHAIMNIMEPIWISTLIKNTYSCIKKRGIHAALRDIQYALKDKLNTIYCLKLDIRKFYPSIDNDILKMILRKKIKDKRLLDLLDNIVDSSKGVPIGNYLSLFFANIYLTHFDHWLKEEKKITYYFRYADDIIILHKDKQFLRELFEEMKQQLDCLKLQFKDNYLIFKVEDRSISFVGYNIYHTHIRVRKNIKRSMCRKAARLAKKKNINIQTYRLQMCSHIGWIKHCNGAHLLKKILRYKELLVYIRRYNKIETLR